MGFSLSAAHLNHGFRAEAAADAEYARRLCEGAGARFRGYEADVPTLARERGLSDEEAGREARHEALFDAAGSEAAERGLGSDRVKVALAHNKNDQAETVLMRVIRGTGVGGLAAMPYSRTDRSGFAVVRPLLDVDRGLVEAYCAENGLRPVRDRTNDEPVYVRNRIRLELLPSLARDYNSGIVDALCRLAANAAKDRAYLEGLAEGIIKEGARVGEGRVSIPAALLREEALGARVIVKCFEMIGLVQDIDAAHIAAAERLAREGRSGRSLDFPAGYRLSLSFGDLIFHREGKPGADAAPSASLGFGGWRLSELAEAAGGPRELAAAGHRVRVAVRTWGEGPVGEPAASGEASAPAAGGRAAAGGAARAEAMAGGRARGALALDFDRLAAAHDALEIRGRRPGDFMRLKGMSGRKKLQDLFTEAKLPARDRDAALLAAAGSEVLAVLAEGPAGRATGGYPPGETTKRVLFIDWEALV
jgi:tRNA(Ile)-lysidine synthase